jgi:Protein of unknown function (DUF3309)
MGLLLLIVLVLLIAGSVPAYPYSRRWGYRPSGLLGILLLFLLIIVLVGWLPWGFGVGPVYSNPVVP